MRHPAAWWTSARIRALCDVREESQAEFARRLDVDDETVRRWLRGSQSPGIAENVRRLNDLAEQLSPAQRASFEAECAADEGHDMNHREKLQLIVALMAEAGLGRPGPGTARKVLWVPGDPIDAGVVAAREGIMTALVAAYTGGDPGDLQPTVASFADGLLPLFKRAPTSELGLRVASLLVDAHAMAGVLASNVGDPAATMHHLALASHVAAYSGDPILKARAWVRMSTTFGPTVMV